MEHVPNLAMGIGLRDKSIVHPTDATSINMANVVVEGERLRALDRDTVDRLKADIVRQGLLQPIGVKASVGARGGPYRLLYGLHRLVAMRELHEEDLIAFNIPAIVFPEHTPDWHVQLAEIAENLWRKELTAPERDAHTMMYAGIVKQHGDVASGAEVHDPRRKSHNDVMKPPTTTEQVAKDLGIDKQTVHNRVARAAKAAGVNGVTIERSDGDTLINTGKQALAKAPDTIAAQKQKAHEAGIAGRGRRAATKAQNSGKPVTIGKVTAQPVDTAPLLAVLDRWEKKHGIGLVQAAVQAWWKRRYPPGRVVFNHEYGN